MGISVICFQIPSSLLSAMTLSQHPFLTAPNQAACFVWRSLPFNSSTTLKQASPPPGNTSSPCSVLPENKVFFTVLSTQCHYLFMSLSPQLGCKLCMGVEHILLIFATNTVSRILTVLYFLNVCWTEHKVMLSAFIWIFTAVESFYSFITFLNACFTTSFPL